MSDRPRAGAQAMANSSRENGVSRIASMSFSVRLRGVRKKFTSSESRSL